MTKDFILTIAALLLSTGVLNFVQFLIGRHDRKKDLERVDPDRFELLVDLQIAHTQELIITKCRKYMRQGYITVRQKASLKAIYNSYKKLGGDQYATSALAEIEKLETRESPME